MVKILAKISEASIDLIVKHDLCIMQMDMDDGQSGQTGQEDGRELIYRCLSCNHEFPSRDAAVKHRQRTHHRCAGVDVNTGEILDEIGKGRGGAKVITLPVKKAPIGATGDQHIEEHYKGYSKDKESYLFVMNPDGTIRDLRLAQPLLYPIYELMKKERGYLGDFPQFIADAVETLFANAGYELALAPKSHGLVYEEVTRLLQEGKLELVHEEGQVRLGVKNGYKNERAERRDSSGGKESGEPELSQGRSGEEESSQP